MEQQRGRIDHTGFAHATRAEAIHIKDIALELGRGRAGNGKLCIAVRRARQDRVQQHFDALRRQLPCGFGEPHVIADRQAEPAHIRHVKDAEICACRDA